MKKTSILSGIALTAAATLALSGCAGGTGGTGGSAASDAKSIEIAVFNGWDEGIAASYLWQSVLEDKGYKVKLTYADVAPVYQGLARGDFDLVLDTWLPTTHADYMERYGDKVEDLGAWNNDARLTIAVNENAPIDSLDQLAGAADQFGGRIVGIEPGSGLMRITGDKVVPGYGLGGMQLVESSTPAMLAELKKATDAGQNIAVTLWRPHWAYNAFPVKDLEDPDGLLGAAEGIHSVASTSFADEFPDVQKWISAFRMDNELLYSLEDAMFNGASGDDHGPAVAEWVAANRTWVDALTS